MKRSDIYGLVDSSFWGRGPGIVCQDITCRFGGVRVAEFSLLSRVADPIKRQASEVFLEEHAHERTVDLR